MRLAHYLTANDGLPCFLNWKRVFMEKQLFCHALLEMLREASDEDHVMKTRNIIGRLELDADMQIGRHKLYSAIRQLRDLGEGIVYDKHEKGYYLASRPLTKGEVFMLCNAIHASKFYNTGPERNPY